MATLGPARKDGSRPWLAHWREDNGRQRTQSCDSEVEALDLEKQRRQERENGTLAIQTEARETTTSQWITGWWAQHSDDWTLHTQRGYARVINKYLAPELGPLPLAKLTPGRIAKMRDQLIAAGEKPSGIRYAMSVLSSCLGPAVERDLLPSNPCVAVKKPRPAKERIRKLKWPPDPEGIELIRAQFLGYRAANSGPWTALRSATLTSVLAYAGLRTEEAIGLKLGAFDPIAQILKIEGVFALEYRADDTKTHYQRIVELEEALAQDLELWIAVNGFKDPEQWLFPPERGGEVDYFTHNNWAKRPWKRARDRVVAELRAHGSKESLEHAEMLKDMMPRHLRSGYVSLLARAGYSDADIAEMSGHSVEVLRKHYMGALRRMRRMPRLSVGEQVRSAREAAGMKELTAGAIAELQIVSLIRPRGDEAELISARTLHR
jgi:integrase